ncbi:transcriptional activator FtrA [Yersinia frederiksenii]|uniref:Transcriptional activator FtrA n=2 Tax=Yersinia frederiksenii TaxID=29484 RepID=A0A380Q222_YERFR|nr:helix-turn-helix domain-containing protein [Yersinia frederiksenii]ATM96387.1 AraC family transcriptional regulator [Yersinia frederiksenii]EEQ15141.1 transcriptional regulator [Yersinia frederiksenii ATCC 33641]KGA48387.1 helix-turn-helix domain protein [Yersinia frederiksenii ATCC 33641]MDN0121298.1 helix-turn-helix domain-containing protein [Yersinia frederiksenii]CNC17503.1 transcriptional activator FtrA [Yersinia frederiksenii]
MSVISVAILVTPGFSTYHVSVPLILFGDTVTDQRLFTRLICAEKPGLIWSDEGTAIQADHGLDVLTQVDTIIVPFWGDVRKRPSEYLLNTLIKAREAGVQIVGLCLGTFVLAYAGLLDGHMAATHWEYEEDFRKLFPSVHLNLNELYVDDDGLTTSAGTAAAMDCCLYIIRQHFGSLTANHIARRMVTPPHREGGQAQYIDHPVTQKTADCRINMVLDYLLLNLQKPHDINSLAEYASMSRRTLTRHFTKATGMSVVEWITAARLHRSQELLENMDLSIEQVAEQSGFQSAPTFRQQFREKFGVSPREWRKTFHNA